MESNLKALAVVLAIAITVFSLAKPLCLRFMAKADFERRRNVWFILTVTAFVSVSFWVFVIVAIPLLAWAARKDSNVVALYLLFLLAVPPIGLQIPTVLINRLFELDYYRLLSLVILVPVAWRLWRAKGTVRDSAFARTDVLLLSYCALQLLLLMPYETLTNSMRRATLMVIDILMLYYVVGRTCTTRSAIVEAMACFCLSCAIAAPIALFETTKGWLLYTGVASMWGNTIDFAYLYRADSLRAQAAAGHSITLGYVLAMGLGIWLYLRTRIQRYSVGILVVVWLWTGLIAAYSRAPWLVAVVVFFAYVGLGPRGSTRVVKYFVAAALLAAVVLATPMGEKIIDNLPFVGTVDAANVTYRQRLAAMSWELIKENPFFGSPFVLLQLESLRQGQGIIDLVNTYATIGMYYGLVGLSLFLWFFIAGMLNAYRLVRRASLSDPDLAFLGSAIIACMVGTLFMMATGSFGSSLAVMFWSLPGLATAYAKLGGTEIRAPVSQSLGTKPQPNWSLR